MAREVEARMVAVCGSLRDGSRTRVALAASEEVGMTTELVDLRDYELPSQNATDTDVPVAERTHRLGRELALYAGVAAYPELTGPTPTVTVGSTANH